MKNIRLERDYERNTVAVIKSRGKLTLDDITDALLYTGNGAYYGHYVIVLNCTDSVAESATLFDPLEEYHRRDGDSVILYPIEEREHCPVCAMMTPLLEYCPECGAKLKQRDDKEG